jgi:hypothetical protein
MWENFLQSSKLRQEFILIIALSFSVVFPNQGEYSKLSLACNDGRRITKYGCGKIIHIGLETKDS